MVLTYVMLCSWTRQHHDLELVVSQWSSETHTFIVTWGEFPPTLEEVSRLTLLPVLGETNSIGIVLEEVDQVKVKYLTTAMMLQGQQGS